jgi:hypothetical protein
VVRRILALCLVVGLGLPPQLVRAQSGTVDADMATGIRQVREGDFDAALITLDGVVKRLSGQQGQAKELARAYTYLAIAYVGLAQQESARAKFLAAWKADKSMTLSPKEFPPNIIQFFEEAKKEGEAKAGAEAKPPAATPGPAPSPVTTTEKAEKKGGGHTGLIILGVVGGAAAVVAIAAAGKGGGSGTTTPAPTVPSAVMHINIDPNPITAVSSGDPNLPWDFRFNLEVYDSGGVGFTISKLEIVVASALTGFVLSRVTDSGTAGVHYPALGRVVRQFHESPYRMENFTRQAKVTVNYSIVDDNGHHFDGSTLADVLHYGEIVVRP